MLENKFKNLLANYTSAQIIVDEYWMEIEQHYSDNSRHYHNLQHLENMFAELKFVEDKIENINVLHLAVFYHDIIYDATKNDNEEQSAILLKERLLRLGLVEREVALCEKMILATKGHSKSNVTDINYLVDIDLSILGASKKDYIKYTDQIRQEYKMYPLEQYKIGRKFVIEKFLALDQIYKTSFFNDKFEKQAKQNLKDEIVKLIV